VPSISFQPVLTDMKAVLRNDFFTIPRFQRPYSWSAENLDEFWRDVIEENSNGYFIGPMVAYEDGYRLAMVDGQQRMTSIMLALCAIRDELQTLGASDLTAGIMAYIERPDDDNIKHFVLESAAAGQYLTHQFLKAPPRDLLDAKDEEQRALRNAFKEIQARIEEAVADRERQHPDGADHSEAATTLKAMRDKLLSLQVIWIKIDNEDDAYVVFETLNSRGKDLDVVDLLKNHILSDIRAENGDLDSARIRWNEIRTTLSDAKVNPNHFILHWWLSSEPYTAVNQLFKKIRATLTKGKCESALMRLRTDAELYAKIAEPRQATWAAEQRPIAESLRALNIFGVRQPRPLLLALLRSHAEGKAKLKTVKRAFSVVESYHFVTTAVVGVSSTGGISQLYAKYARNVSAAPDAAAVSQWVDQLAKQLQESMSERDTFVAEFVSKVGFSEAKPQGKRLVQYTLRRLQDAARPHFAIDHNKCNIEHLGPQSLKVPWVSRIGNLLWIEQTLNHKLGSIDFATKVGVLRQYEAQYDLTLVTSETEWGEQQVQDRGRYLAEVAYDKVWSLSGS